MSFLERWLGSFSLPTTYVSPFEEQQPMAKKGKNVLKGISGRDFFLSREIANGREGKYVSSDREFLNLTWE